MKIIGLFFSVLLIVSCSTQVENHIEGTWQMVYAQTMENDSISIKDLSNTNFIKIINQSHFAFFNQDEVNSDNFYGGAGTYTIDGNNYVETLSFIKFQEIRGNQFPFHVEIIGDTLIQSGIEEVESAGINREVIEKYIRINTKK